MSDKIYVLEEDDNLPTKGLQTMNVVGLVDDLDLFFKQIGRYYDIQAIRFGVDHSIDLNDFNTFQDLEQTIIACLNRGYWCLLEIDATQVETFLNDSCLADDSELNHKFIPILTVSIPYISQLNYNTRLMIDDHCTYPKTNIGVWVHPLHELKSEETLTRHED